MLVIFHLLDIRHERFASRKIDTYSRQEYQPKKSIKLLEGISVSRRTNDSRLLEREADLSSAFRPPTEVLHCFYYFQNDVYNPIRYQEVGRVTRATVR